MKCRYGGCYGDEMFVTTATGKRLVEELVRLKDERRQLEERREDLARTARVMQSKAQHKRSQGSYDLGSLP